MISPIYDSAKMPLKLYIFETDYPFFYELCFAPTFNRACEFLKQKFGDVLYDNVTEYDIEEGLVSTSSIDTIEVDDDE